MRSALLDALDVVGQIGVLNAVAHPAREIATRQVVMPGGIIHAVRELHEQHEILRPQVEAALRAAKVEAAILAQLSFRVFAQVAATLAGTGIRTHLERTFV